MVGGETGWGKGGKTKVDLELVKFEMSLWTHWKCEPRVQGIEIHVLNNNRW